MTGQSHVIGNDATQRVCGAAATVRRAEAQHRVQDGAKAVNVGRGSELLPFNLLRRHVWWGAGRREARCCFSVRPVQDPGQTEIDDARGEFAIPCVG